MTEPIIKLEDVNVTFQQKNQTLPAVQHVNLDINQGDIYGIVGYSGAGKSTLSRTINLLQNPTSGKVTVNGRVFFDQKVTIKAKELRQERQKIGMIFQHFNLLNEQTVIQNVAFALKHSKLKEKEITAKSKELLELVGLGEYANSYAAQLSGGQQQRVAIARALANDPKILISDESTSALDPQNTNQILDLLKDLNKRLNLTVILITHEIDAVKRIANKVAVMDHGQIIEKGSLIDVFIHPKQELTQKLIGFNDGPLKAVDLLTKSGERTQDETFVKLTYTGGEVNEPIVVKLYKDFSVAANIIYSNVDFLGDQLIGTLFISLQGDDANIRSSIAYLNSHNVTVEEIQQGKKQVESEAEAV
ncbi:ATP-binding cassette domain-containing protein [Secundilactobacillus kimchicus]|uniref:methionine ABC transporter ATP-binding protein n=2 Tax=Secundilactobacillus TaxID=2767892 RepID=UPI001C037A43|nr:ATP-binding cassette domain-containing protein [Secundilactobacillus kimchicus]MBT9671112.1 ATP-binding cassette domain-containing protein [Secundilactobacillus kimchicus]